MNDDNLGLFEPLDDEHEKYLFDAFEDIKKYVVSYKDEIVVCANAEKRKEFYDNLNKDKI
jgi:hypothetical protein